MAEDSQNNVVPKARIEISDRNMKAYLVFDNPVSENNQLPLEDITKLLVTLRIKFGIKYEEIQDISEGKKEGSRFLIAEGILPVAGDDATFEFYFATDSSFRPTILEDGHVDYKEVNLVKSVMKDAVLIKKTPATPGKNGMDVYGNDIRTVAGKNYEISTGSGVYKDPKDPTIIKSSVDGVIFYDDRRRSLEVQKLYVIQKSVDYSSGNVNVKSSVEVRGDVKPYFTITTPYDVQIKGVVDNATITCGGALSVTGGIVGDGKLVIKTGGDIHTAYINNHHIKCGGSLYVNTEIRNAIVECDNEIVMVRESGVIIGGHIAATNKITSAIFGNPYSVHTQIEVGIKMELREKFHHKDAEKKAMQKKIEEIRDGITKTEEKAPSPDNSKYVESLFERLDECNGLLDKLVRDIKEIEVEYYNVTGPTVIVTRKIYPGVIIKIKQATFEVNEELARVKFILEDGAVKYTSF